MQLVGRKEEQQTLRECFNSGQPEFVAVYGRRRIGKTFLIKEVFRDRFEFYTTGIIRGRAERQLQAFMQDLSEASGKKDIAAKDWFEAFAHLKDYLLSVRERKKGKRMLVFLDELPWFDTQKSEFISALDYFWNSFASSVPEMMLIACGSAASWMTKNLILSTGGLHNRVTRRIVLKPFTLAECREFYDIKDIVISPYQIIETYMVLGGVPFYLNLLSKRKSPSQNINDLCFKADGELTQEFQILFRSLFNKAERHMRIVEALASRKKGLTRAEIARLAGLAKGGTLTELLRELELSGFIRPYRPFGRQERGRLYQLVDPFTLFYFNFMHKNRINDDDYWLHTLQSGGHNAWSGYAFEQVCQGHIRQIKDALGISGIVSDTSSWRSAVSEPAVQIDLVIDRSDGVINLCEMKYANEEFVINKAYDRLLRERRASFTRETNTKKAVHITFVSVYGLAQNEYAGNVQSEVTADALFG